MNAAITDQMLPPPTERRTLVGWLRKNLFSNWSNSLLSLLALVLAYFILKGLLTWAFTGAQWEVIPTNLRLFIVGQYPPDQLWRLWISLFYLAALIGLSAGIWQGASLRSGLALLLVPLAFALLPFELNIRLFVLAVGILGILGWAAGRARAGALTRPTLILWALYFPIFIVLIRGFTPESGFLPVVGSNLWGGLLLTLLLTVVGIVFSFPVGVLLALGRRSNLTVVRTFSILYIEVVRGVPLITILFMAQLMLPLFLPDWLKIDRVIRAMVGITLFSAAYLAENVRGGLQVIPHGQYEAAHALGLNSYQTTMRIVLPQALRAVIPILVGQFISLFKDTSLVAIVGLFDLLGIARTVLAQPAFIGRQPEVLLFISLIYWVFSYIMSYYSQRLETRLGVGER